jgi:hypothetical protein
VDIHGKKDKLSNEAHRCTAHEITVVGMACAVEMNDLQILRADPEAAAFLDCRTLPDFLPISDPAPP